MWTNLVRLSMCEFKVFLEDEKVMEDVIYAKVEGDGVVLRDILGETKIFENRSIEEVNVFSTKLILK